MRHIQDQNVYDTQDVKAIDKIQNWFNQEPLMIILYPTHVGILVKLY